MLKESVSATYTNERKCLSSIISYSFSYTIYILKFYAAKIRKIFYAETHLALKNLIME
nr:MAG TPA: hypothetical protein [Caudoviricetes sp.]